MRSCFLQRQSPFAHSKEEMRPGQVDVNTLTGCRSSRSASTRTGDRAVDGFKPRLYTHRLSSAVITRFGENIGVRSVPLPWPQMQVRLEGTFLHAEPVPPTQIDRVRNRAPRSRNLPGWTSGKFSVRRASGRWPQNSPVSSSYSVELGKHQQESTRGR